MQLDGRVGPALLAGCEIDSDQTGRAVRRFDAATTSIRPSGDRAARFSSCSSTSRIVCPDSASYGRNCRYDSRRDPGPARCDNSFAVAGIRNEDRISMPARMVPVCANSFCQSNLPVVACHTRTPLSPWPVTIRSPDGDHAAVMRLPSGMPGAWCSRWPARTSKNARELKIGIATREPSGE